MNEKARDFRKNLIEYRAKMLKEEDSKEKPTATTLYNSNNTYKVKAILENFQTKLIAEMQGENAIQEEIVLAVMPLLEKEVRENLENKLQKIFLMKNENIIKGISKEERKEQVERLVGDINSDELKKVFTQEGRIFISPENIGETKEIQRTQFTEMERKKLLEEQKTQETRDREKIEKERKDKFEQTNLEKYGEDREFQKIYEKALIRKSGQFMEKVYGPDSRFKARFDSMNQVIGRDRIIPSYARRLDTEIIQEGLSYEKNGIDGETLPEKDETKNIETYCKMREEIYEILEKIDEIKRNEMINLAKERNLLVGDDTSIQEVLKNNPNIQKPFSEIRLDNLFDLEVSVPSKNSEGNEVKKVTTLNRAYDELFEVIRTINPFREFDTQSKEDMKDFINTKEKVAEQMMGN